MCLCASSYSAKIEIAFSVVLFGNIFIALFLIHNYRRQGPPYCEQTCSLFARSLCSHRTVRTTNSANKPRSSNSTEMTVSTNKNKTTSGHERPTPEYESVNSNCPTFFEYYHRYFERNIFLPLSRFVYRI